MRLLPTLTAAVSTLASGAGFPEAAITNGKVAATFLLPDPAKGYYRGTRFDWSGAISSLRAAGHEYFGQWFPKYDPTLHDAIMGPVEEFQTHGSSLGYDEAAPGGTFIRIGVGAVRKPEEAQYQRFKTYDIVDHGKWTVKPGKDKIEFVHELSNNGYAYRYSKTVRLTPGKTEMVIEHTLENKGAKVIETDQYNHNFLVIDGQPSGPDSHIEFPFDLKPSKPFQGGIAESRGREIVYNKELQPGQSVIAEFDTSGTTAYDIKVENRAAGAGVRILGDRPIAKLVYWSIRTTTCPEPYIDLKVEPGRKTTWKYTYQFYDLKP